MRIRRNAAIALPAIALAIAMNLGATTSASANNSPVASCSLAGSGGRSGYADAQVQYLIHSSTTLQETSYIIETKGQKVPSTDTDLDIQVFLYRNSSNSTPYAWYEAKKGTHYYNEFWGPTLGASTYTTKGQTRLHLGAWFFMNSSPRNCTSVSFTF